MSASDKKKLRAAERAEKLTERQQAEQKEAKNLKIYTTIFVVILALMVCFAAYFAVTKTIENSGIREKNTVALTIGEHELSNAELNYYYIDSVNTFYNQYGAYASVFGLDVTKPLNEQVLDEESGKTWADDFMDSAINSAKAIYALNDAAEAAGFVATEEITTAIDTVIDNAAFYALYYYGYSDVEDYLKAMYGHGASKEGYRKYVEMSYIADAYQAHYAESLTYEDADLREEEAKDYNAYTSYSFNTYEVKVSNYEDAAAAENVAKLLTAEENASLELLNKAIAALPENAENPTATSNASTDVFSTGINSLYAEWVTDASREAGDVAYFEKASTTTDEAGTETTKTDSYYVVMFTGRNENTFGLANVRHILIKPEGGTYDSSTGLTNYTDEEKAAAKEAAEALLNEWKSGEATEDSFAALANEKSADGDGTTGGLYENVYPGQMVDSFENWCFDEHEVGDTGIVESPYGYHIMFYSGESDLTYRDFMIENDLRNADYNEWYEALVAAVTATTGDTKYINTDLVLSNG